MIKTVSALAEKQENLWGRHTAFEGLFITKIGVFRLPLALGRYRDDLSEFYVSGDCRPASDQFFLTIQIHISTTFSMPRASKSAGKSRHDPLLVQLDEDEIEAKYGRVSKPGKRKKGRIGGENDDDNAGVSCRAMTIVPILQRFTGHFRSKDLTTYFRARQRPAG